jgi:hypothetical protein
MSGYGDGYQNLFRFLGQRVETPRGSGKLEQVLGPDCVRVTLDTQANPRNPKMTEFNWREIIPEDVVVTPVAPKKGCAQS